MAYVLATYQRQEDLTDEDLAGELNTLPDLVVRLALCKRPLSSSQNFAEQVRELAGYTLADAGRLAGILRQVDSLEGLSRWVDASSGSREGEGEGLLAAARDRVESADIDTPTPDSNSEPDD
jgi:hypothetical protein